MADQSEFLRILRENNIDASTGLRGLDNASNAEQRFQEIASDLDVNTTRTLEVTAQPEFWTDRIADLQPFLFVGIEQSRIDWLAHIKIFHRMLMGVVRPEHMDYFITLFLTRVPSPFVQNSERTFCDPISSTNPTANIAATPPEAFFAGANIAIVDDAQAVNETTPAFGRKGSMVIRVNNKLFEDWYSQPDKLRDAKSYFHLIATIMARSAVKESSTLCNHVKYRAAMGLQEFTHIVGMNIFPRLSNENLIEVFDTYRNDINFLRSTVKFLAMRYLMMVTTDSNSKASSFYDYAVKIPFAYHGMHLIKQIDKVAEKYRVRKTQLRELFARLNHPDVNAELENYYICLKMVCFFQRNSIITYNGVTSTAYLWQFSRIFEGRCFLEAAIHKNKHVLTAAIYMLPQSERGAEGIVQLHGTEDIRSIIRPRAEALWAQRNQLDQEPIRRLTYDDNSEIPDARELFGDD